ncbi:MAG: hypothetical protein V4573_17740 [Pseudomonadota bacterium]
MTDKVNWQDHREIERWMADWAEEVVNKSLDFTGKDDPADELRHRLARGDFRGRNAMSVTSFLDAYGARAHRVSDQGRAEREERSAAAAERSADAASTSAKWAGWSILVSLAALALAAWPYFKKWLGGD